MAMMLKSLPHRPHSGIGGKLTGKTGDSRDKFEEKPRF
jgi:hypothetical protein